MLKFFLTSIVCCVSVYVLAQPHQATPNKSLISTEVLPNNQVVDQHV